MSSSCVNTQVYVHRNEVDVLTSRVFYKRFIDNKMEQSMVRVEKRPYSLILYDRLLAPCFKYLTGPLDRGHINSRLSG